MLDQSVSQDWLMSGKAAKPVKKKSVVTFRCSSGQPLTVRATNLNFLELNVSDPTFFLIFLLYGYVEGHMTLDDFW